MSGRLLLLGTGTCELDQRRAASSVLVEVEETRFLFDIGRGIAVRLHQVGLRQDDVGHIVISHYHPDHFSDLIPYLHAAAHAPRDPRTRDLHIYGPEGLEKTMENVLTLSGLSSDRDSARFTIHHRRVEDIREIDGLGVESISLPPAGNRGIRFLVNGRTCALTGDSDFHEAEIEFIDRAAVCVVDAGHLSDEEIVALASQAQPEVMVCSHIYRELNTPELLDMARKKGFAGRLIAAEDLMEIPFGVTI